jgi:hypothetical protein
MMHGTMNMSYVFNIGVNKQHNNERDILTIFRLSLAQTTVNVA